MKEFQQKQEEAKLLAMKNEAERIKIEEILQQEREERLRLEQEKRDKKKMKEKQRIQRKKDDGSYLTKEQREKLERARIQLEAAGIQVPVRQGPATATTNTTEQAVQPVKKRVLYDDRRKKPKESNNKRTFLSQCMMVIALSTPFSNCSEEATTDISTTTSAKSESQPTANDAKVEVGREIVRFSSTSILQTKDELKDEWDQESEEETNHQQEKSEIKSTERE
jgi:translation initiation factor 5B